MLPPLISGVCTLIGSGALLFYIFQAFRFFTFFFIAPRKPLKNYKRADSKSWAVISGSSAGIGFELADQLLSLGFGVIIFAHEGIEEAEARLRKAHPSGAIQSFTFNCLTASPRDIEELVKSVQHLNITILSNNVSGVPMPEPRFRPFAEYRVEDIDSNIDLSARFMARLTLFMIPVLEKSAQPRSLIINMSSGGRSGVPYVSLYSACKGFNSSFSNVLAREFRVFNTPIDCLAIIPGEVVSHGNNIVLEAGAPTAKEYAKIMVERIDAAIGRGLLEVSPHWKHSLQIMATNVLPESIIAPQVFKIMESKKKILEKGQ